MGSNPTVASGLLLLLHTTRETLAKNIQLAMIRIFATKLNRSKIVRTAGCHVSQLEEWRVHGKQRREPYEGSNPSMTIYII